MRTRSAIAILCALAVTFGCQDSKPPAAAKPANATEAMARVDAALQIGGHNQKDEALAAACRSAAEAGAVEAVLKGLPAITAHNLRDEVAGDCALKLRDAGQANAATEVAKMISAHNKRDEVLKKLASGS